MQYWNGTDWVTIPVGIEGQFLRLEGGTPTWVTITEVYVLGPTEVLSPATNRVWMDRNLGASQVATSIGDADAFGDLYQWGRPADGHQIPTSNTDYIQNYPIPEDGNFIISNGENYYNWTGSYIDSWNNYEQGANNPCPSGYRIPTKAEWAAERASWSSDDIYGAFDSPLKLTLAYTRHFSDGVLRASSGTNGTYGTRYWTETSTGTASSTYGMSIWDSGVDFVGSWLSSGYPVRCIKD